ncbi:MAG: glycosyltransferase [Candidatus Hadarchaeota archaeon]
MMRISVIVPTFNEGKTISRCLESIKNQTFKDYELVVVDGHSKDNTVEVAKMYTNKIIFDEGKGATAARNLAVRKVNSEIVVFVDGDTTVPPNYLEVVDKAFKKGVVGVGGPLLPESGSFLDKIIFFLGADLIRRLFSFFGSHHFSGASCAYLRETYIKAGGFREDLDMLDDVDLSIRMNKYGKEKFEPKMLAVTSIRRTKQKGHASTVKMYLQGYLGLFKTGQVKKKGYLREIKK